MAATQTLDDVRKLIERYSNWGRWGADDEKGTLNFLTAEDVVRATRLVQDGLAVSLAIPFDEKGPQTGGFNRFNPIHLMTRDGSDALSGALARDFYPGKGPHFGAADDLVIMPLQCGTQWDALAHIIFEGKIYNGFSADLVSSKGAHRGAITNATERMMGRGVLLDLPRSMGVEALDPGYAITGDDLAACADRQSVAVARGDFVMVRTGRMLSVKTQGWGDYCGGPCPGIGLDAVPWIADHEITALCTDTWGMEVLPNETSDLFQPLHVVLIVHLGLWVGEIFDFEALSAECAARRRYEFLFCAPPLPISMAVASPINPIAVL